ncbi:hypothetical protein D3C72_2467430 [compost metagenome]
MVFTDRKGGHDHCTARQEGTYPPFHVPRLGKMAYGLDQSPPWLLGRDAGRVTMAGEVPRPWS